MRVPTVVRNLIAGRHSIDPRDLVPRRSPHLRPSHPPLKPAIPAHKAAFYAHWLTKLGHDPASFNLPAVTAPLEPQQQQPAKANPEAYQIGYVSPAARRVGKEMGRRVAKINFVQAQMAKMQAIIGEWRERKRVGKAAKAKKYPF